MARADISVPTQIVSVFAILFSTECHTKDCLSIVIGGGGAASSTIFALWRWVGSTRSIIANRLKAEVDALITLFQSTVPDIVLKHLATVKEAAACGTPYIVNGTIPNHIPRESGEITYRQVCNIILCRKYNGIVLKMRYLSSLITKFYTKGEESGWAVIPGTEALVRACIAQQIPWLEKDVNQHGVNHAMSTI